MFSKSEVIESMANDFCKEFALQQEKYMVEGKERNIVTSPAAWVMLR